MCPEAFDALRRARESERFRAGRRQQSGARGAPASAPGCLRMRGLRTATPLARHGVVSRVDKHTFSYDIDGQNHGGARLFGRRCPVERLAGNDNTRCRRRTDADNVCSTGTRPKIKVGDAADRETYH